MAQSPTFGNEGLKTQPCIGSLFYKSIAEIFPFQKFLVLRTAFFRRRTGCRQTSQRDFLTDAATFSGTRSEIYSIPHREFTPKKASFWAFSRGNQRLGKQNGLIFSALYFSHFCTKNRPSVQRMRYSGRKITNFSYIVRFPTSAEWHRQGGTPAIAYANISIMPRRTNRHNGGVEDRPHRATERAARRRQSKQDCSLGQFTR